MRILAAIGVATGVASAQSIEGQSLPPPDGAAARSEIDEWTGLPRIDSGGTLLKPYHNAFGPFLPERVEEAATVVQGGARIRQLDKMSGRIRTLYLPSGYETSLDRLTIRVESCLTRGKDSADGAISHLSIWDARDEELNLVFSGWMFSESPALSALDHPRYDVWVMSCIAKSGGAPSASE